MELGLIIYRIMEGRRQGGIREVGRQNTKLLRNTKKIFRSQVFHLPTSLKSPFVIYLEG
jgi:hypothetical protein